MAELQDDVEDQEEKIRSSVKEEKNDILKRKYCHKFVQFISPKTAQDLQSITNKQRYSG